MVRIDDYLLSPAQVEVPFTALLAGSKASSAKIMRGTEENGNRKSLEDNRKAVGKEIRQMLFSSIQNAAAITFF